MIYNLNLILKNKNLLLEKRDLKIILKILALDHIKLYRTSIKKEVCHLEPHLDPH